MLFSCYFNMAAEQLPGPPGWPRYARRAPSNDRKNAGGRVALKTGQMGFDANGISIGGVQPGLDGPGRFGASEGRGMAAFEIATASTNDVRLIMSWANDEGWNPANTDSIAFHAMD